MVLVWQAIRAALLPIDLRHLPYALNRYLQHLYRSRDRHRRRKIPLFFEEISSNALVG